jgi:peptidoglycan/LPS O-acetylase OafA/YrhL
MTARSSFAYNLFLSNRNLELDRLRAAALVLVTWFHIHSYVLRISVPGWLAETGAGIELFFAMSGYIITVTLASRIDQAAKFSQTMTELKLFFVRRFFRVIPVMFTAILVTLALSAWGLNPKLFGTPASVGAEAMAVVTFSYNFFLLKGGTEALGWFWSMSIEEQFYVLFPLFLILVRDNGRRLALSCAYIAAITFVVRPLSADVPEWPYYRISSHLKFDSILGGCALYFLSQRKNYRWLYDRLVSVIRPQGVNLLSLALVILLGTLPSFAPNLALRYALTNLFAITLIYFASLKLDVVLASRIPIVDSCLFWLASRSYCLYMFQHPVFYAGRSMYRSIRLYFGGGEMPYWISMSFSPFILLLCIVVTEVAYRLIESPIYNYGHNLTARRRPLLAEKAKAVAGA